MALIIFFTHEQVDHQKIRNLTESLHRVLLERGFSSEIIDQEGFKLSDIQTLYIIKLLLQNKISCIIQNYRANPLAGRILQYHKDYFEIKLLSEKSRSKKADSNADLTLNYDLDPDRIIKEIIKSLELKKLIPRIEEKIYTDNEEATIKKRLKDLGYI